MAPTNAAGWQAVVSGNAVLTLSTVRAGKVEALRMDFDFKGGGGFVVARRADSRLMPEEYAVTFRLRGTGPVNNLELKLVDAAGQNVWRHVQKDLRLPERWKRITVASTDIEFAWGPSSGGHILSLGSMEIAIVAGEGGKGSVWIADVRIEDRTPAEAPHAAASSALPGYEAAAALLGGWRPRPDDLRPWITIDSIAIRAIGGLVIDWVQRAPAGGFRVRGSTSGVRWKTLYAAASAGGTRSYVYLPGVRTRFLRLELDEPTAGAALRLQSFEFSRSIHAFWNSVARDEARGWHPRWVHNRQTVWTPFGTSHGLHCGLMNEDGMVEIDQGSFSIEPMLWILGRLFTWADFAARQELLDGWKPVPAVIWESAAWRLRVQAEATGSGVSRVRYRLENLSGEPLEARLFLLLRPFQVTPPWQSFRGLGGVSPIRSLLWDNGAVRVNGTHLVAPATGAGQVAPTFGALRFDEGFMAAHLAAGALPAPLSAGPMTAAALPTGALPSGAQTLDPFGFATGALAFDLSVGAGRTADTWVNCAPLAAAASIDEPAFDWGGKLAAAQWTGGSWMNDAVRAALTATAHILVTRSGPALQPGPRRYTRSWIRDGAMMGAALLRMGHTEEVREFIRWYAPKQRADGFVPCCVDAEGTDWLVEHDSHGQLLALIADYHRFTSDAAFLQEAWTFVAKAAGCIESLLGADGLLPISVSHEGYLAQPVHSYWDDFWAVRGLADAAHLAEISGRESLAARWRALDQRLRSSLWESIEATRAQRALDFIPGSIEWADFDPTATANAIYLLDVPPGLNRAAVDRTFDKYLADWRGKRSGAVAWQNYTPYEIRIIGALVRLGRRAEALELLRFFLSDRRPQPWNQWPEIAWRDHEAPAHVGDLPHTWIAAEYVLAVRALFAYEREADRTLVLAAGVAQEWIDGSGLRVDSMPTLYGPLSYSLRRTSTAALQFDFASSLSASLVLRPPLGAALRGVLVDGVECATFDQDSATLTRAPAQVIMTT